LTVSVGWGYFERGRANYGCVDGRSRKRAVGVVDRDRQQQALVRDHGPVVVSPIGMLTRHASVIAAKRLEDARPLDELSRPLGHDVLPGARALHVKRGPRGAAKVVGLGPGLGDRDLDPAVVIQEVEDVGELRPAVRLDGGQDAPVVAGEEGAGPIEVHGQTMTQPAPEAPRGDRRAFSTTMRRRQGRQSDRRERALMPPNTGAPPGQKQQPAPSAPAACWQSSKRNSYLFFEDFFAAFFLPPAFFFAGTALTSLFGNSPGLPQHAVRRRRSRVSAT